MTLSTYVARVYGARAVAREIGERREEKVEKTARDVNWVRFAFLYTHKRGRNPRPGEIGFVSHNRGSPWYEIGFVSNIWVVGRGEIGFVSHFLRGAGWLWGQIGFVS